MTGSTCQRQSNRWRTAIAVVSWPFAPGRGPTGCSSIPVRPSTSFGGWAALRGRARNNPAVPVRIGAEIVRHQERAERFGRSVAEGWLKLVAG